MNEEGIVKKVANNGWITVRFDRKAACDNCRMCLMPKDKAYVELKLKNTLNAKLNDKVVVSIGDKAVIKASFIVYIIPLLTLGLALGISINFVSELTAVLISLFGLAVGFAIVAFLDKNIKKDKEYLPKLVSIIDIDKEKQNTEVIMNNKIIELNDNNFKDIIGQNKLTLVDFWATWCMPCKMLLPIIDEVAAEIGDSVNICKLDVDKAEETASIYSIMSVPTMIIFKNGEIKEKMSGLRTKAQILSILEKHK